MGDEESERRSRNCIKECEMEYGRRSRPGDSHGATLTREQGEAQLHKPFFWYLPLSIIEAARDKCLAEHRIRVSNVVRSAWTTFWGWSSQSHPKRRASKQHASRPPRVLNGGRLACEPRKASWLGASLAGGAGWLSTSACQLWWMPLLAKDEEWASLQRFMRLISVHAPS